MTAQKDILIVGGGLAGCFHAAFSALKGHRITLIDAMNPKAASRVAAGLFNVVTGREANKTWMADEMLETIHRFLAEPAFCSLERFFHFMPVYKPFVDGYAYNEWMVCLRHPEFERLGVHVGSPQQSTFLENPIGGLRIQTCGWAEVAPLCEAMLDILRDQFGASVFRLSFPYALLDPESGVLTGDIANGQYDEVVFAEGIAVTANPWFQFVDIKPLKGQIIDLKMKPGLDESQIYLRKTFLIPKGDHTFSAGSTYEIQFEDDNPTQEGIETLEGYVREQVSLPFETIGVRAAIRPTTRNRRPILGRHPDFPRLAILNGMGTKGVLQAPWSAHLLRGWLDGEIVTLSKELVVDRFLKKNA